LTDAGWLYFGEIESLFRRLDAATRELRSRHGRRSLRLKVAPFFASEFLLPRLGRLDGPRFDADLEIAATGSGTPRPRKRVTFDTMTEMVHAAERATGVALIPVPLAHERLRAQTLLRLFEHALRISESYHLLYRQDAAGRPEMGAFRDWILAEASHISVAQP